MTADNEKDQRPSEAPAADAPPRRITSEELFLGSREVLIAHKGQDYRLRITALGRLILTK